MTLNTNPKVRSRVRLLARAQKCASCGATILRGAWAWRECTGRYTCDATRCLSTRAAAGASPPTDRFSDLSSADRLRGGAR